MEYLPEEARETKCNELFFEDLWKLPGADVACICDWLVEQVEAISTDLVTGDKRGEVCICL